MKYLSALILSVLFFSCDKIIDQQAIIDLTKDTTFTAYWYQQKAEMNSYLLSQARYGELRKGEAVLVFVTEDFSASKQVKLDNPSENWDDRIPVLKLNFSKKFNTGIYPYSMMSSIFTPIKGDDVRPLKLTNSNQEWCGQTFTQLNKNSNGYLWQGFSYFEQEGDDTKQIYNYPFEDNLFNTIRTLPKSLLVGSFKMYPSLMYARLMHKPFKPYLVEAELKTQKGITKYSLYYPKLDRTFIIHFKTGFPYQIEYWKEEYASGWGKSKTRLVTEAKLKERFQMDYWNKNSIKDSTLRKEFRVLF